MDIVGDEGVWLWSDLGLLTLHARTRRESKSSVMSCSRWSTMDILMLVRGDVGEDIGWGNGSGDSLWVREGVFILISKR